MLLSIDLRSSLEIIASSRFWDIFRPDGGESEPPDETKGVWLISTLENWGRCVGRFYEEGLTSAPTTLSPPGYEELGLLLQSLSYASDILLEFRRQARRLPVPRSFLTAANDLLVDAESRGLRARGRDVYEVAQRLAAATAHTRSGRRPVRVDDDGRVFYTTGERAMSYDPTRIRGGRADIEAGRALTAAGASREDGD